ncbi:MAG TPA: DnaD domain protein [Candidatus Butyricicoccus avistercoris]|uniref:DnaD domain protein n=1 Tax=Candidatus Butyricicoccus avistercoris TaxID=2838518 RepID=A0A9D1TIY3_9FIRM|nr:DnaD domain protein [Candidatus Butyricicoccus avistercoris]
MSLTSLLLPDGELRVIRCDITDKIISCSDGDSALLYLYIVKTGTRLDDTVAMRELNFSKERYERAVFTLSSLMIEQQAKAETANEPKKARKPNYTSNELRIARNTDHKFSAVCDTAEVVLGTLLKDKDIKSLYLIYDYLGLPAEVIIELLSYLKRDRDKVDRHTIEREAYIWTDAGIYTYADAQKHLEKIETQKPLIEAIFKYMNIVGREPSIKERQFASACLDKGFTPEAVELAINRMYANIERYSLNYLKKILLSWHEKGLHTVSEITAIEPEIKQLPKPVQISEPQTDKMEDWEIEWLEEIRRYQENNKDD